MAHDVIAVFADDAGVLAVAGQGYLRLPLSVRRWCRLSAGDRLMLAAYPEGGLLVLHPPVAFDALLDEVHRRMLGVLGDG